MLKCGNPRMEETTPRVSHPYQYGTVNSSEMRGLRSVNCIIQSRGITISSYNSFHKERLHWRFRYLYTPFFGEDWHALYEDGHDSLIEVCACGEGLQIDLLSLGRVVQQVLLVLNHFLHEIKKKRNKKIKNKARWKMNLRYFNIWLAIYFTTQPVQDRQ